MLVGDNGIITQAQKAKENTELAQREEEKQKSELIGILEQETGEGYNTEKKVNTPKLASGMTPIKFTDPTNIEKGTVVETTNQDTEWYNYEEKKWANARTKDRKYVGMDTKICLQSK